MYRLIEVVEKPLAKNCGRIFKIEGKKGHLKCQKIAN
jgi:hypothetical protein